MLGAVTVAGTHLPLANAAHEDASTDDYSTASGTPVTIQVMKHICDPSVQTLAEFMAVDGPDTNDTSDFHDTVLACPTVVMPGDSYADPAVHFPEQREFMFTVTGGDGTVHEMADAVFHQETICETDISTDVNGDGALNACLDTSHYEFRDVMGGTVTVTETETPGNVRPGALKFTPTALIANSDAATLIGDLDDAFASGNTLTLDTTKDDDGNIMLHVYNFQNLTDDDDEMDEDEDMNDDEMDGYTEVFSTHLTGDMEVPPVATNASGQATVGVAMNDQLDYVIEVNDGDNLTAAHLHCGAVGQNGPVVVGLFESSPTDVDGALTSGTIDAGDIMEDLQACNPNIDTIPHLVQAMREGMIYVNVHSTDHPAGVIRGQLEEDSSDDDDEMDDEDSNDEMDYSFPSRTNNDPYLILSPYYLLPGNTFTVQGDGFVPHEEVEIMANGMTDMVTANGGGEIESEAFMVPFSWINSQVTISARGDESNKTVSAQLSIGSFYPVVSPSQYYFPNSNGSLTFTGHHFAPGETVNIMMGGSNVGNATADGGGGFSSGNVTLPTNPGRYEYTFRGEDSGTSYTVAIYVGT